MFRIHACDSPVRARCPTTWAELDRTDSEVVRHCYACNRRVHLCTSEENMLEHVSAGRCVAVWVHEGPADGGFIVGETGPPYSP